MLDSERSDVNHRKATGNVSNHIMFFDSFKDLSGMFYILYLSRHSLCVFQFSVASVAYVILQKHQNKLIRTLSLQNWNVTVNQWGFLFFTISTATRHISLYHSGCEFLQVGSVRVVSSSSNRTGREGRPRSSGSWSACAGDGDTPSPLRRVAWDTALTPTTRTCATWTVPFPLNPNWLGSLLGPRIK